MTLCIYHAADHDGKGSAAIVRTVFKDAEFYGHNHDMAVPYELIEKHNKVVICDIALPMDYMFELNDKVELIWIDHHISVIKEHNEKVASGKKPIEGLRKVGTAAIELTWQYFYPDREIPEGIKLLALNDLYDLRDEKVRPFEYAMQSNGVNKPDDKIWEKLINNDVDINFEVKKGEGILSWIKIRNYRLVRELAFESELNGMKCLCANMPQGYSEFFDSFKDLKKYDFLVNFYLNKRNFWKMTFYSNKKGIDVSEIAASFGGGGHQGAAGASIEGQLPDFLKPKK